MIELRQVMAQPTQQNTGSRGAVIDVGTNSVKLLVVALDAPGATPIEELSVTTRLGRGFYPDLVLQPLAIADTARVVGEFVRRAKQLGVERVKAIATSAAREAKNGDALLDALRASSGLDVEIISGEREASLAFRGVASSPHLHGSELLVVDVGGGSTEFILGGAAGIGWQRSFPMGVVRLIETLHADDSPGPEQWERCRQMVREFLHSTVAAARDAGRSLSGGSGTRLVGVGGSATVLAAMEQRLEEFRREAVDGAVVSLDAVRDWERRLWAMPMEERRRVPGLPPPRADVILTGVSIYAAIMETLDYRQMTVSARGLRYAVMEELR